MTTPRASTLQMQRVVTWNPKKTKTVAFNFVNMTSGNNWDIISIPKSYHTISARRKREPSERRLHTLSGMRDHFCVSSLVVQDWGYLENKLRLIWVCLLVKRSCPSWCTPCNGNRLLFLECKPTRSRKKPIRTFLRIAERLTPSSLVSGKSSKYYPQANKCENDEQFGEW